MEESCCKNGNICPDNGAGMWITIEKKGIGWEWFGDDKIQYAKNTDEDTSKDYGSCSDEPSGIVVDGRENRVYGPNGKDYLPKTTSGILNGMVSGRRSGFIYGIW